MADLPDLNFGSGSATTDSQSSLPDLNFGAGITQAKLPDWSGRAGLQYEAPTWSDYGAIAGESFAHTLAGAAAYTKNPSAEQYWRKKAEDWGNSVSLDARSNFEASLGSQRWKDHPFSSFALNAASQLPQLAAIGGAEAIGGPVAAGAAGALVYGAGAADALSESVHNASPEELGSKYQQLVGSGMSDQDARNQITQDALRDSHAAEWSGLLGAGIGVAGPIGQAARGPIAGAGIKNFIGRMGLSGVEAGLLAGGQDLGSNLALNQAYGNIGLPQTSPQDMATSAGKQVLEQGLFGAALGGFHRGEKPEAKPEEKPEAKSTIDSQVTSPAAEKSQEAAQTPSAPLRSAQAAPLMPEKDMAATDEAKRSQAQDRHETPVSGENVSIRSSREGRTKPAAGRDFGRAEDTKGEHPAPIPPSPVSDDQGLALHTSLEVSEPQETPPTIDSQLPPETVKYLQQLPPERIQSIIDSLRHSGDVHSNNIADMLLHVNNVQKDNVQPEPVINARAPSEPTGRNEPIQATPLAPTPEIPAQAQATPRQIDLAPSNAPTSPAPPVEPGPIRPPAPQPSTIPEQLQEVKPKTSVPTLPLTETVQSKPVELSGTAQRIHEALKEEPVKEVQPKHEVEWKKKARQDNNTRANKVIADHLPSTIDSHALLPSEQGGKGGMVSLRARLTSMMKAAEEEKVNIPKSFRATVEGGSEHAPSVMLLDEARRFLEYTKGKLDERGRVAAVEKFLFREQSLRKGEYADVLKERSSEAEAVKTSKKEISRGEKATEAEKLAEKAEKADEQLPIVARRERTPYEELVHKERLQEAKARLDDIVQKYIDAMKVKDKVDPEHLAKLRADAGEALKAMKELGFEPKTYKMSEGEEREPITVLDTRKGTDLQYTDAVPIRSINIRDSLKGIDYKQYHPAFRGMMKILAKKLTDLVGDMPVHIFDSKEWNKFMDPQDMGGYNSELKQVYIHQDFMEGHTPLHEAFHAATVYAYETAPEFRELVNALYNEVGASDKAQITQETRYAFSHPIEMLTEMMSNPEVQKAFKKVTISPELAKKFGISEFRKASIFRTVLDGLRKVLGFEPKYITAMEAAASLGEQMMHEQFPAEEARFKGRLGKPTIDSQEGEIYKSVSSFYHDQVPDRLKESIEGIQDKIKYEPQAIKLKLKDWFDTPRERGVQMEKMGHFKESFRSWLENMSKQGYERTQFLKKYIDVAKSIGTLAVKKPQEFTKLVDLLLSAARNGAHPDEEDEFTGRNSFLKPTNPAHWEALSGYRGDRTKYLDMEAGTQKIFRDIRDKMTEVHKADIEAARESLIKNYRKYADKQDKGFRDAFEKVAKDQELTPKESEKYGDDPYIQDIHHYNRMISNDAGKMFYFPMKRTAWKYAITGTHDYAKPEGARNDPNDPHRFMFDDVDKAYDFTGNVNLPSYREVKHYFDKPDGSREYTVRDDIRQTPEGTNITPKKEYHVVVHPEHTEFANSLTEGERIREAMNKAGIKDISGVMPVQDQGIKKYGFYGPQIEAMKNRIDKLEHVSPAERKAAQDAIEHTAIASMRGNYLPQSLLPRRRIMGTDNIDVIQSFWNRIRASANFQTMAAHRNEIDEAVKTMQEEVKNNRTHKDITEMQSFYNMIQDRTMNFATDDLDDMNMSTLMHHVQSIAIMKYLASPAFLAYHQLHVPLVVIPRLAKEIGWFPAFRMALNTYRQMLGGMPVIGKGIKGGFKRFMDYDKEPTDFIDALMSELKKHGGKDDELRAMQWALEQDVLSHTGINFSSYFKGMGQIERFEQRSMNVSHEILGSADAVNRFNSMLTFYRAARDKLGMKNEEEAFRWAADRVAETQGQFTAFNRVGLMRSPNVRAVMQFKSFPLILMKTVTKALYNSLRWGASKEERVDSIKTLAGLMGASMAISGVQGAVPEPVEDINNILSALGLTNTWDQYEDKLREYVADNMGTDAATYVMNGVVGGGLGVDLTHRGGISNLTGLARLHVTKPQDLENSMFKWMAGVPGSIFGDGIDGANAMETGDIQGAMRTLLPRVITDPMKAYQLYNQGVTTRAGKVISAPLGLPDTLKQALGLAPLTASHAREARYLTGEERATQQPERQRIEQMYASGKKGDAIKAMNKYNEDNPSNRMKLSDLQRALKESAHKKVLGYDVTKKNKQEMEHRVQVYGVPQ